MQAGVLVWEEKRLLVREKRATAAYAREYVYACLAQKKAKTITPQVTQVSDPKQIHPTSHQTLKKMSSSELTKLCQKFWGCHLSRGHHSQQATDKFYKVGSCEFSLKKGVDGEPCAPGSTHQLVEPLITKARWMQLRITSQEVAA